EGCSVAACDVHRGAVAETEELAKEGAPAGTKVTSHSCDVADEAQVLRFRDEVLAAHAADHVDLVFSNAGIGGGGSFIADPRNSGRACSRSTSGACTTALVRSCRCLSRAPRAYWSIPAASTA